MLSLKSSSVNSTVDLHSCKLTVETKRNARYIYIKCNTYKNKRYKYNKCYMKYMYNKCYMINIYNKYNKCYRLNTYDILTICYIYHECYLITIQHISYVYHFYPICLIYPRCLRCYICHYVDRSGLGCFSLYAWLSRLSEVLRSDPGLHRILIRIICVTKLISY